VPTLVRSVFSVTRSRRRRFLWCAWWTGEPTAAPFRPPDAWAGGARTEKEAELAAARAAGTPVQRIEGRWAGAWVRVRAGLPAFPPRRQPGSTAARAPQPVDPHALLGVAAGAPLDELKAAFRRKALEHHPDRGGQAADFIALKRAYDRLVRRRAPGKR
jgi:hypothetical protein